MKDDLKDASVFDDLTLETITHRRYNIRKRSLIKRVRAYRGKTKNGSTRRMKVCYCCCCCCCSSFRLFFLPAFFFCLPSIALKNVYGTDTICQSIHRSKQKKVQKNAYLLRHGHTFSVKSPFSSHKTKLKQQING